MYYDKYEGFGLISKTLAIRATAIIYDGEEGHISLTIHRLSECRPYITTYEYKAHLLKDQREKKWK